MVVGGNIIQQREMGAQWIQLPVRDLLVSPNSEITGTQLIRTSSGEHRPGPEGNFPTVRRGLYDEVESFFRQAEKDMLALSVHFASPDFANLPDVIRVTSTGAGNLNINVPATQDSEGNFMYANHTVVVGMEGSNAFRGAILNFPTWFNGNFVINIRNGGAEYIFPRFGVNGITPNPNNPWDYYFIMRQMSHRVIFNFPEGGTVGLSGQPVWGSVLAPQSHFEARSQHVNGILVAASLQHYQGFEQHTTAQPPAFPPLWPGFPTPKGLLL